MCVQAICVVCSKPISISDKTCPHCNDGEPLDYRIVETKKCPECGQSLNIRHKRCPQCGKKVEFEDS
jgi:predicted amidophosphoribosyltransferase